ncbi:MAG: cell division protein FtsZ [Flavobacteriaceae bacterium]|nr:cell division protein FtsZ [Flavobacteriaceae bacterium]|tara:strand:- start:14642 stop:16564 length:1923 start_codon:yes stop_codon:yes gene_type:complete
MDKEKINDINFDLPKNKSNVIKVIGVGGGGSNAINYMFKQGIVGVDFVVTNTDAQALSESPVPIKIQLGASLTEGLGAGANPEIGAKSAEESYEDLQNLLMTQTKMVFITAGMGGGTGTGAAPVIAKMAKKLEILTVGIVTMPFQFEGKLRLDQAQKGLLDIKESVDALIVINNNKLREVYGNLGFKAGFSKADEVLATAARGIAEVITHHYTQNIDLKDAKTVLTNSGTAIMGSGSSSGSNRAQEAIIKALDSPLLNDNKITGCKNVLLLIVSGSEEITIDEIGEINDYIQTEAGNNTNIIMGVGEDKSLGNEISVTIIATGFGVDQQNEISNTEAKKIIHTLEDDQLIEQDLSNNLDYNKNENFLEIDKNNFHCDDLVVTNEVINEIEVIYEDLSKNKEIKVSEHEDENKIDYTEKDSTIDLDNDENKKLENNQQENFVIKDISNDIKDIEVFDYEIVLGDEFQTKFDFEIPLKKKENDQNKEIEKIDTNQLDTKAESKDSNENIELENFEDIKFEVKGFDDDLIKENINENNLEKKSEIEENSNNDEDFHNAFETPIEETFSSNPDKRKEQLKEFNYKFKHKITRIDDMENEPAYKRMGLDINENIPEDSSRLSLDSDSNEDLQIRSNNSFLHDNVD